jgi:hypothetical protein
MGQSPTITDTMEAHALEAVNLAQATAQQKLDFSEDSIKAVEKVLDGLHKSIPRDLQKIDSKGVAGHEVADWVSNLYGAYIGEVMRRNIGGDWVVDDKMSPGTKIISFRIGHLQTCPSAKVYKRIINGSEDDVWFYYRVLIERHRKMAGTKYENTLPRPH